MSERDALLRAICDNPDDDTARLVFADWLQEHGDEERAEFIRLQIQLSRGNYRPSEEAKLKRRLKKLNVHTASWKLEFPKAEHVAFRRGFIERACLLNGNDLERVIATAPLQYVWVRGVVDLIAALKVPGIDRVDCLDLESASIREVDIETFLETEWPIRSKRLLLPSAQDELRDRVLARFRGWAWIKPP